jgi:angio-associated migratory cell protein
VHTGELLRVLEGPEDIEWACWHSKGNCVLAGSKDGTIWMWLVQNGQCMAVFSGHDGLVSCGSFCSDGKLLCSGGEDGTVRVWQPRTAQCSKVFQDAEAHEAAITCLVAEGDYVLTGSLDGTARLYTCQTMRLLNTFLHSTGHAVQSNDMEDEEGDGEEVQAVEAVAFSSSAYKWLCTAGADKLAKVWDYAGTQPRIICTHGGGVVAAKWHSALPLLVTAALDRSLRIWDARDGRCCLTLTGHVDLIVNLSLSSYREKTEYGEELKDMLVSVSDDRTARVYVLDCNSIASSL